MPHDASIVVPAATVRQSRFRSAQAAKDDEAEPLRLLGLIHAGPPDPKVSRTGRWTVDAVRALRGQPPHNLLANRHPGMVLSLAAARTMIARYSHHLAGVAATLRAVQAVDRDSGEAMRQVLQELEQLVRLCLAALPVEVGGRTLAAVDVNGNVTGRLGAYTRDYASSPTLLFVTTKLPRRASHFNFTSPSSARAVRRYRRF